MTADPLPPKASYDMTQAPVPPINLLAQYNASQAANYHDINLRARIDKFKLDKEARTQAEYELQAQAHQPLTGMTAAEWLKQPLPKPQWSIQDIHMQGTNTLIVGDAKDGKTTIVMNLIRAFCDGDPMFGHHYVNFPEGRIALLSFEGGIVQTLEKIQLQGIKNLDKIYMEDLDGHTLDLLNEYQYEDLKTKLIENNVVALVIDNFGNIFLGDENDNTLFKQWAARLDQLKKETGVLDCFMPIHRGHRASNDKRQMHIPRGASAIPAWCASFWSVQDTSTGTAAIYYVTRRSNDPKWLHKKALAFDSTNEHLSYDTTKTASGNSTRNVHKQKILEFVQKNPGCSQSQITNACGNKRDTPDLINELVLAKSISQSPKKGRGGGLAHTLTTEAAALFAAREMALDGMDPASESP